MTTPHSANTDPQPEKKTTAKKKRNYKIIFGVVAGLIVLLFAWYFWSTRTVEESTKDGYVTKVARVGTIIKTYEGELNLAPTPIQYATSLASDTWDFSIKKKDKDLYDKLLSLQGKVVKVSYRKQAKSFPWQGNSKIFVYDVVEIDPSELEKYLPEDEDPAVPGERDTSAFY